MDARKFNFIAVLKERYWFIVLLAIFLFSFILDIYLLTRYSLSYGTDGAFYDIQISSILKTGLPASNDPPLVYYLLTPFVILTGNSFLGIKLGMALLGSLMVFPAFLLTQCYIHPRKVDPKVPALLSAFLIIVNINYFAMIGDFMQNLVGVVFLIFLMYFIIKWLENIKKWQKYGVLTVLFLGFNLLTHIYTGALAVILFISLLIFSIVFKTFKTDEIPRFDLKILGLMVLAIIGCFTALFITYPLMFYKFMAFMTSFSSSSGTSNTVGAGMVGSPISGTIFFSLPYLLGIAASLIILYRGLKEKVEKENINSNTLVAWLYLTLGTTIGILSFLNTEFQSRFVFLAFLPIALIIPLGLKYFESVALIKYPAKKRYTTIIVTLIALIFAFSSFYVASGTFMNLKPTITTGEYQELLAIKNNQFNNSNTVILVQDFQSRYWAEYVLDVNVSGTDNLQEIEKEYGDSSIYILSINQNNSRSPQGNIPNQQGSYSGGFLLPYGPPLLTGSIDKIPSLNSQPQMTMTVMPMNVSGVTVFSGKYYNLVRIR